MRPQVPHFARIRRLCTLIGLLAFTAFAGCMLYPMGLNKQQWESLSPVQQAEYRARQHEIDVERARQAALRQQEEARLAEERARAEQERAQERARAEQERLAFAYRHARYGDIITVSVQGGEIAFNGKRHPYEPIAFELIRGECKEVQFARLGSPHQTTSIIMRLAEDGNTFYFDAPARKHIVIVNDGWEQGRTYTGFPVIQNSDGHSEAIGISIRIAFKPPTPHHRH
jgi:hypothetical protein